MKKRSIVTAGVVAGAVLFGAGAFGIVRNREAPASAVVVASPGAASSLGRLSGPTLDATIAALQARLQDLPGDDVSWATLGLAYVQQAKVTVDSDYYPKAEGALMRSLDIRSTDNHLAYAGLAALANARHDFTAAQAYALQGLRINPYSDTLYGALSDAEIQLGEYEDAYGHIQQMVDLSPDTTSLSRASYAWELRGNVPRAIELMEQARDDAPDGSARAFAEYYLGDLAFNSGDPNTALVHYRNALEAAPGDAAALEGKARAEAAIGQTLTAIDDYAAVVAKAPEPAYLIEYGELLESVGRHDEAQQQYAVFEATQQLFGANGVEPDADPALFYANHGSPERALAAAEEGIATRPFIVMYDAYAWALHVNGRDDDALVAIDRALSTGYRSALFNYHRGMILVSLGRNDEAEQALTTALDINPHFSPLAAPLAAAALEQLRTPT